MKRAAHRYVRFPLFSGASGVLNAAGTNVPTLLFAAFFGAQPVGWFALAQRVVAAPMALVGQSVAQVYFSTGAKLASEPRALRSLFLRTAWHMLVIGALPCTILILAGRWLFPFVFGSQWVVTGQYVQIMAVMFLLQFVTNPISSTLDILERQDLELAWNIGRFVLVVGALAGAGHAGWSPLRSIMAYSVAMSFAYLSLFLLLAYAISRRRIAPTSQLREA